MVNGKLFFNAVKFIYFVYKWNIDKNLLLKSPIYKPSLMDNGSHFYIPKNIYIRHYNGDFGINFYKEFITKPPRLE